MTEGKANEKTCSLPRVHTKKQMSSNETTLCLDRGLPYKVCVTVPRRLSRTHLPGLWMNFCSRALTSS